MYQAESVTDDNTGCIRPMLDATRYTSCSMYLRFQYRAAGQAPVHDQGQSRARAGQGVIHKQEQGGGLKKGVTPQAGGASGIHNEPNNIC